MNGLDQEEQTLLQAFEAGELRRAAILLKEKNANRNTRKRCS